MGNVNESVSQELPGIIDDGAENFSVDLLRVSENGELQAKTENDGSADNQSEEDIIEDNDDKDLEDSETSTDTDKNDDDKDGETDDSEKKSDADDNKDDDDSDYSERVRKRIGKINTKRRAAEKLNVEQSDYISSLEERLENLEGGKPSNAKPVVDDYDTEEEFIEAVSDWKAEQTLKQKELADAKEALQEENDRVDAEVLEHMKKGGKKYKDFGNTVKDLELKRSILPVLNSLKSPHDVMHYLGKNPDIADDLNDLVSEGKPMRAGMLLQKIATSIKGKKFKKAPTPIRPGGSNAKGGVKTLDQMSNADYRKARDKQEKDRRGRHY